MQVGESFCLWIKGWSTLNNVLSHLLSEGRMRTELSTQSTNLTITTFNYQWGAFECHLMYQMSEHPEDNRNCHLLPPASIGTPHLGTCTPLLEQYGAPGPTSISETPPQLQSRVGAHDRRYLLVPARKWYNKNCWCFGVDSKWFRNLFGLVRVDSATR